MRERTRAAVWDGPQARDTCCSNPLSELATERTDRAQAGKVHSASADIALFVDAENICLACRHDTLPFAPAAIHERARLLGRVIMKRAYADWSEGYMGEARRKLQEEAFDLVQLSSDQRGKNTADIQLALDALEVALSPRPPATIVIVSGDRDFVPLTTKLKSYRVQVVGISPRSAVGRQFKNACDIFIEYDHLVGSTGPTVAFEEAAEATPAAPVADTQAVSQPAQASFLTSREDEAKRLLTKAVAQLLRQGAETVGAAVMQMMSRIDNSFSLEKYPRYSKFLDVAEDAQDAGLVRVIRPDQEGDVTIQLTPRGQEFASVGALPTPAFSDAEVEAKYYAKYYDELLRRKRVVLIPEPWRSKLVRELFEEIDRHTEGMTMPQMNDWMLNQARQGHGLDYSPDALRKLVWSLNLASSFKDKYNYKGEQRDDQMPCRTAVSAEEAIYWIERRYVTGVILEDPDAPLKVESVALWLFGASTEASLLHRAKQLVVHATRRTT